MKKTAKVVHAGLTLGLAIALQAGCAGTATVKQPANTPGADPQSAGENAAQLPMETAQLSGKVVESLQAGGYTYVNLEKDGKQSWAAMSSSKAAVGDEITLKPGMVMSNFTSKALNRSFDRIVFTDGPAGQPPTAAATKHNPMAKQGAAAPTPVKLAGKVVETMESGGYTYAGLDDGVKTTWVALPVTTLSVGEQVEVMAGVQMGAFTSKTLNRTFEGIVFSPGIVQAEKGQLPPNHPPLDAKPASGEEKPAAEQQEKPRMGHAMMAQEPGKESAALSGKVVETMNSGGYTYICLEQEGKKIWAAVPSSDVSVGQELKLLPGPEMTNFTSKSMNKSFEKIIFSSGIVPAR